jgi:Holliday junction resolvasome RuvABC endonuclease subunit
MVILGIDVGFAKPGICVIDTSIGDQWRVLHTSILKTAPGKKQAGEYVSHLDAARMVLVARWMRDVVRTHRPTQACIELPSGGARNATAIRSMAMASGTTVATLAVLDVPTRYVTPRETKLFMTGDADAEKVQMVDAVARRFPSMTWPGAAEARAAIADAVAAALFYATHGEDQNT